jgi:tRNA nucleotidyltransferase/poly(A) polymerase
VSHQIAGQDLEFHKIQMGIHPWQSKQKLCQKHLHHPTFFQISILSLSQQLKLVLSKPHAAVLIFQPLYKEQY